MINYIYLKRSSFGSDAASYVITHNNLIGYMSQMTDNIE